MLALYAALLALVAVLTDRSLRRWRSAAGRIRSIRKYWLIPCVLLSLLPLAGALLTDMPARYVCQAVGNVWLGFVIYYGGLLAVLSIAGAVIHALRGERRGGKLHGAALCLSLCGALALFGYGLVHAQQPRVVSYELSVEKPAAEGEGEEMTLVLIGDLHLGVNSRPSTTERMVELINAESPDLVVVAGDIFTSCYEGLSHPERYAEALRGIRSRYGVYAVYGNHDVEETLFGGFAVAPVSRAFRSGEMEAFCRDSGFVMLTDEIVTLPNGVQLAGRIDGEKAGDGTKDRMTPGELLSTADHHAPILVLQHEPVEFGMLAEAGADVTMCGHTHAGQIFPGNLIVPLLNENGWGYRRVDGLDTFVTAGVGYYGPPMRVGTDSEITVINMRFKGGE
uniref:Putative phosphohydrolases n=1 Tax=uncultured bacterium Contig575 TaxID=1393592 RepID=W0FN12_9BACT|nr:putative phosphohydrolases [uncultured bacterium Contig575]